MRTSDIYSRVSWIAGRSRGECHGSKTYHFLARAIAVSLLAATLNVDAMANTIPPEIKKIVVFVYVESSKGDFEPAGTAFLVGVSGETVTNLLFGYLVTAKHVLTVSEGGPLRPKVFLRMNLINGGTKAIEIRLSGEGAGKNVFTDPDASVDIAVVEMLPDRNLFDYKVLPADLVTSREDFPKLGISEGTDVFFAGLFVYHTGQNRNYPIVRFGHVALLSDEKVNWRGKPTELYLVESSSYGGNSGSPVFVYLGAERNPGSLVVGPPDLRLAGVMLGAFQDLREVIQITTGASAPISLSNMGVAAVAPSYKLREILFSQELLMRRSKAAKK